MAPSATMAPSAIMTTTDVCGTAVSLNVRLAAFFLNTCILLSCSGVMMYQCVSSFMRYLKFATKATLSVMATGNTTFMAFTVCPAFEVTYNSTMLGELNITSTAYKAGAFYGHLDDAATRVMNQSINMSDGYAIFEEVSYDVRELIRSIEINTASSNMSNITIYFRRTSYPGIISVIEKFDDTYGRCFSIELAENTTALGIISVVITAKMSVFVYLHHPGQYMDIDSKTKIYANAGKMLFIDSTHEVSVNTLEQDSEMPCSSAMNVAYDDCVIEAISRRLMSEFGCVVPWVPKHPDRPVCNFTAGSTALANLMDVYWFLSYNGMRSLCSRPCSAIDVFLGMPFTGVTDPTTAYIKVYVKSMVKVKQTVLDFTLLSMLAELGGYTGLWLGLSVVNLTDIFERVIRKSIRS